MKKRKASKQERGKRRVTIKDTEVIGKPSTAILPFHQSTLNMLTTIVTAALALTGDQLGSTVTYWNIR